LNTSRKTAADPPSPSRRAVALYLNVFIAVLALFVALFILAAKRPH
jgi:hypothetical protein